MGELSKKIIDEYREAREAADYATQAGILSALLTSMLVGGETAEIARETAEAVLTVRAKTA